jgi:sugar lactone lactonase YvrE
LYVADTSNQEIRMVTSAGVVTTIAGNPLGGFGDGAGPAAGFSAPTGIAVDGAGTLYVSEGGNNVIRRISPGGVVTTVSGGQYLHTGACHFSDGTGADAGFCGPQAIAVDGVGNLYVADTFNDTIRKLTRS